MKKLCSLCLILLLLLALTACGGKPSNDAPLVEKPPSVPSESITTPDPTPQPPETSLPATKEEESFPVTPEEPSAEATPSNQNGIDIDLAQMGGMMAYAELSNIIYYADDYIGKVIRITGIAVCYHDEQTDTDNYAVVLQDATACCASGFDLLLAGGQEPPENGREITVTGELEMYEVYEGIQFLRLKDARIDG